MPAKSRSKAKKPAVPKKKVVAKKRTVKKRVKRALHDVKHAIPATPKVCRGCHALPAGSVELVSLLLVLIFSLSAVLFTSVYALDQNQAELEALQAQVAE